MLRLKDGQQRPIEIQPVQLKESKMGDQEESDLQEKENIIGKNQFLP